MLSNLLEEEKRENLKGAIIMRKFVFYVLSLLIILSSMPTASFAEEAVGIKKPKVSVIIPVYKVEPWLRECMDSVINQTLKEIEIICVDDGSPDNCGKILDEYASKDNRITVIHQKNQGVSVARNTGLELAHGEYITFVDSDDYIELDTYEKTYQLAKKDNVDILQFQFHRFTDGKDIPSSRQMEVLDAPIISASSVIKKISPHVWNKLFKAEIIQKDKLRFIPKVTIGEDIIFSYMALAHAEKIKIIQAQLYKYRIRPNSVMYISSKEERLKSFLKRIKPIYEEWRKTEKLAGNERLFLEYFMDTSMSYGEIRFQYAKEILNLLHKDIYNEKVIKKCHPKVREEIKKLEQAVQTI